MTYTDGSDAELVRFLRPFKAEMKVKPSAVRYNAKTLMRHFESATDQRALWVIDDYTGSISIDDLAILSTSANSDQGRHRLFLAAMVWGLGRRNGRMLPGIKDCMTSGQFAATLRKTASSVRKGLPAEAYQQWVEADLPGLGEAFFTKWLFAVGLSGVPETHLRPFVLDSQVWKSLKALGWSSECNTGFKYRNEPAAAYGAYLAALRRWSAALSTTPDAVEQLLFRQGGTFEV